jgi:protein ImuB
VRLGLGTLGDFAALPAPAVLARFGPDGVRAHRVAAGLDELTAAPTVPPPELVETYEFDPPATRVDEVAFAAKELADRLLERLGALGLSCSQVVVEAETEHGERHSRCWRHEGGLTAAALTTRVRWQLDAWLTGAGAASGPEGGGRVSRPPSECDQEAGAASGPEGGGRVSRPPSECDQEAGAASGPEGGDHVTAGLTLLRLAPDQVVGASGRQLGLWGGDAAGLDRAERSLARLQGMLGQDAVVTAVVAGGRTPAERVRWVPWGEPRDEPDRVAPWPGAVPGPAPARVHTVPVPAELLDAEGEPVRVSGRGEIHAPPARLRSAALPEVEGVVVAWAGPWAHDLRWWDRVTRRRRVLWQVVVTATGARPEEGEPRRDHQVACLVAVEGGRATVEAVYD